MRKSTVMTGDSFSKTPQTVRKRDPIGGDGALLTALSTRNQPVQRSCVGQRSALSVAVVWAPG